MGWWWRTLGLLVRPKGVLTRRARSARCHWWLRLWHEVPVVILVERWWRCWRVLQVCDPVSSPVTASGKRWRCWSCRRAVMRLRSPWLTWRATKCAWLVCLRVHILGQRRTSLIGKAVSRLALEQCQACLDVHVCGVEVGGTSVCVERITCLVVARLVQRTKVIPDLRNVRVEADGTRVRVKRVAVLVDLVVKNTNRTPECWVATVTVYSLLVGFVGLGVFLLRHVASAKKVPALGVVLVW